MSSSNNRTPRSSPNLRHRSWDRRRYFGSIRTDGTWNGLPFHRHRSTIQPAQLANQLRQLQVHSDVNSASSHSTQHLCRENESLAEEELIERLKETINEFMTRPARRYGYNTTMRWTVNSGNQINYSVVILIDQLSDLII